MTELGLVEVSRTGIAAIGRGAASRVKEPPELLLPPR